MTVLRVAALDIYSLALLTAILLAAAAVLVALLERLRPHLRRGAAAAGLSLSALGFAAFAASYHLATGHRPGSAEELAPLALLSAHPALVVTLVAAAGLFALLRAQEARGR